ncbi:glycosyltransferase family 4 protein [Polynucleobacter sp. 71A-WALBACH]|uniref:glycosyltransferase family 4 protein n=1 Tax=Polynucleobacter sp. 71A-WALBACH TaxID=2689097 RepID=UPI001C0AED47|nr:glycosyltransferase family 4 protein [Polynucleobacter sp. 71A-WALBACH]MBU3593287.1 glycosyltransferase family 4 protein [Polynucleobacter sp. 71A-WALBACH]
MHDKKIALLAQWFDPEPTFKGLVFARELVRQGFKVEVITGIPNYPGGKIYAGYKVALIQREVIDGVNITRLPLYPSHDQSAIMRILNYVSFSASALFYGLFFMKRVDVIYAYHPPLTVGIAASLIKMFRRIPIVYDIQDMWPDTLRATGMINNARLLAVVSKVCNWVYRQVDQIVVLSPGFKRLLIDRGVRKDKVEVIYNWADEDSLLTPGGTLPENFPDKNAFKVIFAGNMGKAQALDVVLEAAALLKAANSRVVFVMIGGGVDALRLKNKAADMQLTNIVFLPAVPMAQVGKFLISSDALLVHLKKDPLFQITIPSKTQAYMCVGKPVLMAVDGDASDLVRQSNGGITAESQNPKELARAAERLAALDHSQLTQLGENSRKYYCDQLSLAVGAGKFAEIFKRL